MPASADPAAAAAAAFPEASDWRQIFALLDTALELPPDAQAQWLAALPPEHLHLAPTLAELLRSRGQLGASGFMRPPDTAPVEAPEASQEQGALVSQDQIGPYRLIREIGRGGMASVWLAKRADGLLDREIALKLPHASWGSAASLAQRMARERSILASLTHPNIARLYDAGIAGDGRPYLALEFVEGAPIDAFAAAHKLGVRERVALIAQVARAVAHAHARLVVHRDLKPSNILVDANGQVHLLDFGIAKLVDAQHDDANASAADTAPNLTQQQGRALTPDYASPEQIRGDTIGTASDIYSLGIVMFELLAGARPYRLPRELSALALAEALARIDAPRPSQTATSPGLQRELRGDLDAIVALALRKASSERYATIDAFADDLDRYLRGEAVNARPDSSWYRAHRWILRHKLESAVVAAIAVAVPAGAVAQAAVLIAIGLGAAVALWQMRVARAQAALARSEAVRAAQVKDFALSILQGANTDSGAGGATTATDVLKSAQARIEAELGGQPAIAVELMTSIADGLHGLGDVEAADQLSAKAFELAKRELSPHDPRRLAATVLRGTLLYILDRPAESILLLEPAIVEARRQKANHLLVDALRWKSTALIQQGEVEAGLAVAREAVDALAPPVTNAGKLDAANAWASLASALIVAQRPGQADAARQALKFVREIYGDQLTESAIAARLTLARGMAMEGQDRAALAEIDAVLADTISFFGPAYPRLETIGNFAGHIRLDAGDVEGAITAFELQIEAGKRRSGVVGVSIALGHSAIGKALMAAQRYEEAADHYATSERLVVTASGRDNPYATRSCSMRALALAMLGRLEEADEVFAGIDAVPWGDTEIERAMYCGRLGTLRSLQGRHDEAIALATQSVAGVAEHPSPIVRAVASRALGRALMAGGRPGEAIAPLEAAVQWYAQKCLMMPPDRADAIEALAAAKRAAESAAEPATKVTP